MGIGAGAGVVPPIPPRLSQCVLVGLERPGAIGSSLLSPTAPDAQPFPSRSRDDMDAVHTSAAAVKTALMGGVGDDTDGDGSLASVHCKNLSVESVSIAFVGQFSRVVHCRISGIHVKISGNQVASLATLGLFEEADRLVGNNHLLKRTVVLVKSWAVQAGVLDLNQHPACSAEVDVSSKIGWLSNECIHALVLAVFNAFHQCIATVGVLDGLLWMTHFILGVSLPFLTFLMLMCAWRCTSRIDI